MCVTGGGTGGFGSDAVRVETRHFRRRVEGGGWRNGRRAANQSIEKTKRLTHLWLVGLVGLVRRQTDRQTARQTRPTAGWWHHTRTTRRRARQARRNEVWDRAERKKERGKRRCMQCGAGARATIRALNRALIHNALKRAEVLWVRSHLCAVTSVCGNRPLRSHHFAVTSWCSHYLLQSILFPYLLSGVVS